MLVRLKQQRLCLAGQVDDNFCAVCWVGGNLSVVRFVPIQELLDLLGAEWSQSGPWGYTKDWGSGINFPFIPLGERIK